MRIVPYMATAKTVEDDLGGAYARGEIGLTELNHRAAAAGEAATEDSDPKSRDKSTA